MNPLKTIFVSAAVLAAVQANPVRADSAALENIASIAAAQNVCGFVANDQMVEVAIRALVGDPSQVQEGGRYWPQMQANFERIIRLTKTEDGRRSFCGRVKHDLSAFFD